MTLLLAAVDIVERKLFLLESESVLKSAQRLVFSSVRGSGCGRAGVRCCLGGRSVGGPVIAHKSGLVSRVLLTVMLIGCSIRPSSYQERTTLSSSSRRNGPGISMSLPLSGLTYIIVVVDIVETVGVGLVDIKK